MPPLSVCDTSISILDNHYSLNDLHVAAGRTDKHKPSNFLRLEQTKELIAEIDRCSDVSIAVKVQKGGKGQGTYACRELVYAYAMWISPKFNLAVIRAFDAMVNGHPQPEPAAPVQAAPAALEHKPLNPQQQAGLSDLVYKRARTSGYSVQKIYKELREVFDVHSWKVIPADKYTDAKALVKSMVLEGELMPRQRTAPVPVPPPAPPVPQAYPDYRDNRRDAVMVPAEDWRLIVDCIRGISRAMDMAWDRQGGRSANRYNNPPPNYVEIRYDEAREATRFLGRVYQLDAMGGM